MKWQGRRGSTNIEDRRRAGPSGASIGGIGGIGALAIVVIGYFLGVDLTPILNGGGGGTTTGGNYQPTAEDEQAAQFVSVVLADTEEVWTQILPQQAGQDYVPTPLVLFTGATQSGCGGASAQSGPFYCPADQKVYLDTDFFALMDRQLGAGGDFANAYVVAHEVGHHVQDLLGILDQAQRGPQSGADSNSVRTELQADCFAGVWANHEQSMFGALEQGDIQEAMNAAQQIGDDKLQQETQGVVVPDSFTHGTSEQRTRWFTTGYESGDIGSCNTFDTNDL